MTIQTCTTAAVLEKNKQNNSTSGCFCLCAVVTDPAKKPGISDVMLFMEYLPQT